MARRITKERIARMDADERFRLAWRIWSRLDDATRRDERPYYDGFSHDEFARRHGWRGIWMSANNRMLIYLSQAPKARAKQIKQRAA